jgi:hypothetical protein
MRSDNRRAAHSAPDGHGSGRLARTNYGQDAATPGRAVTMAVSLVVPQAAGAAWLSAGGQL